jgi:2-dehydro-3-deoxygluconokinase
MPELVNYCDVLLGDGNTNALYFGINNGDYTTVAMETNKLFPHLQYIALTARQAHHASHHSYKGFLYTEEIMFESALQNIPQIVDRIGTGDAFMAGLIYALLQDQPDKQYAVDFAVASAAMKHTVYGDHNLISKKK